MNYVFQCIAATAKVTAPKGIKLKQIVVTHDEEDKKAKGAIAFAIFAMEAMNVQMKQEALGTDVGS